MAHLSGPAEFEKISGPFRVITTFMSFVAISTIIFCLTRRVSNLKSWQRLSLSTLLLLGHYTDSGLFIISTAVLSKSYSIDHSEGLCDATILLCLLFYFSSKTLMYLFFVEKVRLVQNHKISRYQDKLYLFNTICVMGCYAVLVVLLFVYRLSEINSKLECFIGLRRPVLIPALIFDALVNVYLTTLFIRPIRKLPSYNSSGKSALRAVAVRAFSGMCLTLIATVTNIITMSVLLHERAWVCLLLCNLDTTICVIGLHYVSSKEKVSGPTQDESSRQRRHALNASGEPSATKSPSWVETHEMSDFTVRGSKAVITTSCTSGGGVSESSSASGITKQEQLELSDEILVREAK